MGLTFGYVMRWYSALVQKHILVQKDICTLYGFILVCLVTTHRLDYLLSTSNIHVNIRIVFRKVKVKVRSVTFIIFLARRSNINVITSSCIDFIHIIVPRNIIIFTVRKFDTLQTRRSPKFPSHSLRNVLM